MTIWREDLLLILFAGGCGAHRDNPGGFTNDRVPVALASSSSDQFPAGGGQIWNMFARNLVVFQGSGRPDLGGILGGGSPVGSCDCPTELQQSFIQLIQPVLRGAGQRIKAGSVFPSAVLATGRQEKFRKDHLVVILPNETRNSCRNWKFRRFLFKTQRKKFFHSKKRTTEFLSLQDLQSDHYSNVSCPD